MRWHDPICLQFHLEVVNDRQKDIQLNEVFSRLLWSISEYIDEYKRVNRNHLLFYSAALYLKTDNEGQNQKYSTIQGLPDFQIEEITKGLCSEEITGCRLSGDDNKLLQLYPHKPTKWGKRYVELQSVLNEQEAGDQLNELSEMLNCPDESLNCVTLPYSMLRGLDLFTIQYISQSVKHDFPKYCRFILDDADDSVAGDAYHHQIHVHLPRFMVKEDGEIARIQKEWTDILSSVTLCCSTAKASIDLDIPHDFSWNDASGDMVMEDRKGHMYFAKVWPGYPWCMLIGKNQAHLLTKTSLAALTNEAFKTEIREDGSLFCQLTERIDQVDRNKCVRIREILRPYLLPNPVGPRWQKSPVSVRMGCKADEFAIDLTGWGPYSVLIKDQ